MYSLPYFYVLQKRDALNRLKQAKDAIRNENFHLKKSGGLVSHPALLRDFEEKLDLVCTSSNRSMFITSTNKRLVTYRFTGSKIILLSSNIQRTSTQERLQDIQQRHSELALKCNTLKRKIDQSRSLNSI